MLRAGRAPPGGVPGLRARRWITPAQTVARSDQQDYGSHRPASACVQRQRAPASDPAPACLPQGYRGIVRFGRPTGRRTHGGPSCAHLRPLRCRTPAPRSSDESRWRGGSLQLHRVQDERLTLLGGLEPYAFTLAVVGVYELYPCPLERALPL